MHHKQLRGTILQAWQEVVDMVNEARAKRKKSEEVEALFVSTQVCLHRSCSICVLVHGLLHKSGQAAG